MRQGKRNKTDGEMLRYTNGESEPMRRSTGRNADSWRGKDKSVWQRRKKKSFSFVSDHYCVSNKDIARTVHGRICQTGSTHITHINTVFIWLLQTSVLGSRLSALSQVTFVMFLVSPTMQQHRTFTCLELRVKSYRKYLITRWLSFLQKSWFWNSLMVPDLTTHTCSVS